MYYGSRYVATGVGLSSALNIEQERYLLGSEIVENLVVRKLQCLHTISPTKHPYLQENKTSRPLFTIRRPAHGGWYIRVHPSGANPKIAHINLVPPPVSSPYYDEAALSFICQTNSGKGTGRPWNNVPLPSPNPDPNQPPRKRIFSPTHSQNGDSESNSSEATVVHSYPPTPPANPMPMNPPSPNTVREKLDQLSPLSSPHIHRPPPTPASRLTHFILAPHSSPHVAKPASGGLFARALASVLNHKPSHATSFTICPVPSVDMYTPPIDIVPTHSSDAPPLNGPSLDCHAHRLSRAISEVVPHSPPPLVTYHDQTPTWTFGSSVGLLEIDRVLEAELGLSRGFVLAISLSYLEYLTEREVGL